MGKIMDWLLGFTKLGKLIAPIQQFLDGYKAYIAGAAIMLPALVIMIDNFSKLGVSYLTGITGTPEFTKFMEGWAIIALRAGISKSTTPPQP